MGLSKTRKSHQNCTQNSARGWWSQGCLGVIGILSGGGGLEGGGLGVGGCRGLKM